MNHMKKLLLLIVLFVFVGSTALWAQTKVITGNVSSSVQGEGPIPGVTVIVKGTTIGAITDSQGNYTLNAPVNATTLVFSYIGMRSLEVEIGGRSVINGVLESDLVGLNEVVVTALGISRQKKSLGYSTQEVKGDQIATVKSDNFINALSGKVSGVQIKKTTNIGGSTNIVVRGNKSLTGNNQTLFVVDGIPINNEVTNTTSQSQAGLGYDYGNAASDINPDDIESINVLKGAAATALYGSRAANGVVMITTKKGSFSKQGLGISINSSFTIGSVDKSTFPEYQTSYGGGYGQYYSGPNGYWYIRDINDDGVDEQWAVTSEDASYGAPFDPSLMVYQWDAVDVESPNYMKATPWVAAKNGPITFFEKPVTLVNSVAIDNSNENGSYRLSYTNFKQNGLLPNSELKRHNILLNGSWKVNSKLTATGSANFIRSDAKGRNSTGYSDNIMGSFRQWFQTNVDIKEMKDAFFDTGRNVTWNWADPSDQQPIFWDNPYWTRYKNYETDYRNRFVGYMALNYKVTSWLELFGRASTDFYSGMEEERRAVGSIAGPFGIGTGTDGSSTRSDQGSGYLRRDISSSENNFDLMANFDKDLNDIINIKGTIGTNIRRSNYNRMISATNGGLSVPDIYSLQNSKNPLPYPRELASKIGVDGIFGSVSLGFKDMLFIDGTLRRDHSSTLPKENSVYYYPSISTSLLFSEFIKNEWLSFGKIRINYAQVGNSAGFDQITDRYNVVIPLNSPMSSVAGSKKNAELKPEKTNSIEAGLEMYFYERRIGFDMAVYKTNTIDQILPLTMTTATGYNSKVINAGEIENKGIELAISGTPVRTNDFTWNISLNWSKNVNKVISLLEGLDNLQLGSYQGGITVNARVGQPYGVLFGTDYTYHANGGKLIDATSGQYLKTGTSDNIIGDINPDWTGGIANTLTYKNLSLGFLVDIQQGGDIFSLDMYYGLATGMFAETVFINDLGNPVRNSIANGGGMINPGVNPNGSPNVTRIRTDRYGAFGYARGLPDRAFVYDASYVKLREVNLSYRLPGIIYQKTFIKGASIGFVGSNLWIMHKNLPYADPESGLGAGNLQGFSTGSLPSTRDFSFNLKLNF